MNFLLRTVFWLGLAFVVIQPHGIDFGDSAQQLGDTMLATGRAAALDTLHDVACDNVQCAGARILAEAALTPPRSVEPAIVVGDAPYPAPPLRRLR